MVVPSPRLRPSCERDVGHGDATGERERADSWRWGRVIKTCQNSHVCRTGQYSPARTRGRNKYGKQRGGESGLFRQVASSDETLESVRGSTVAGSMTQCCHMTKTTETVLAEALQLDAKERAELASELIASLDGPPDPDASTAWTEEIKRRVAALEAGTIALESWDDVRRRIERDILGR